MQSPLGSDIAQNELSLLGLLDSIDGVVFEYDLLEDRFVFVRGRPAALLGYTVEEWTSRGFWSDHLHRDDLERAHGFCVDAIQARRDHQFEYRMVARDGRIVWIHDHVSVVLRDNQPRALRGVLLDITERRAARRSLAQMHDRFVGLLDQLSVGVLCESSERRILFANHALCRAFGVPSPDAVIGQDCRAALSVLKHMFADPDAAEARVEELVARRQFAAEDVLLADGRIFERSYIPLHWEGDAPGHMWQFLDVSQRRRSERALREISAATSVQTGGEFFRVLVRRLTDVLGARAAFVAEVLPHATHRMRITALWDGAKYGDNVECDGAGTPCALAASEGELVVDDELTERFPSHFTHTDFGANSYLGVALYSATSTQLGVLSVVFDGPIPAVDDARSLLRILAGRAGAELERQRAEDALRASEFRNRALLRSLPDLIFALDGRGVFVDYHAPESGRLLLPPEQFLGRNLIDVLPMPLAAIAFDRLRVVFETGESQRFDYELEFDGEKRRFEYRVVAFGDDRALIIARDMTEQRRLEERLVQSQKLESIGRMAGGVAHDFNNLLTGILSYAEIGEQEAGPGRVAGRFSSIREASERAAELTQQLLAFAREQIVAPRVVAPNELVEEMLSFLRRVIGEHIGLETNLAQPAWRTRIDPTQFYQVLMNLVVNARDALPQGGQALVSTRNVVHEREQFGLPAGEYVEVSVRDHGLGMDESTREKAFEPFFTTKGAGRGTGMGLSTCYGIVQQNGGAIVIESQVGEGTLVRVLLPRVDLPTEASSAHHGAAPGGGETILLVEDDEVVREIAAESLQSLGYRVLSARDGAEALELSQSEIERVHLLVTDVVMPRMSGDALAARLRERRPDLPVLFVSGYAPLPNALEGRVSAHGGVLRKPFAPSEFARKVRETIDACV